MSRPYSDDELLAVLLAREVRDGEVTACGALSMIPAAGMLLARETHAPDADLIILGSRAFMPFHTSREFHFLCQRGDLGLFFLSGVQIDQLGNYNLHLLGKDIDRPDVRFPGGYGGGMIFYAARRTVMFRAEHTRRCFVPRVDFISSCGNSPSEVRRYGRLTRVHTPLATLVNVVPPGVLRLESVHAPYTAEDVVERTGFDLGIAGHVPNTAVPSAEELRVLREVVRRIMIETDTYGEWAAKNIHAA
jgi:glutaconate CoA-transferase, subunit B